MSDQPLRVLLVGYGRMGRLVEQLAGEAGVEIVGRVTSAVPLDASQPADVAVDFSTAAAVPANVNVMIASRLRMVLRAQRRPRPPPPCRALAPPA